MKKQLKNLTSRMTALVLSAMMVIAGILPAGPLTLTANAAGDGMTVYYDWPKITLKFHAYDTDGNSLSSVENELDGRNYTLEEFDSQPAENGALKSFIETGLRNVNLDKVNGYTYVSAQMDGMDISGVHFHSSRGHRIDAEGNTDDDTIIPNGGTAEIALYYKKDPSASISVNHLYLDVEGRLVDISDGLSSYVRADDLVADFKANPYKTISFEDYLEGSRYVFSHVTINGSGEFRELNLEGSAYDGGEVSIDYVVTDRESPKTRVYWINEKGQLIKTPEVLSFAPGDKVSFTAGSDMTPEELVDSNGQSYYFANAVFTGGGNHMIQGNVNTPNLGFYYHDENSPGRNTDLPRTLLEPSERGAMTLLEDTIWSGNIYNFLNQVSVSRYTQQNIRVVNEAEMLENGDITFRALFGPSEYTFSYEQARITGGLRPQFSFSPIVKTWDYSYVGYDKGINVGRVNTFTRDESDGGDLFLCYVSAPKSVVRTQTPKEKVLKDADMEHNKTVIRDEEDPTLYDLSLTISGKVDQNQEPENLDVLFILDGSGSMQEFEWDNNGVSETRMKTLHDAVSDLIKSLNKAQGEGNIDVRYAVQYFGGFAGEGDGVTQGKYKDNDSTTWETWTNEEIDTRILSAVQISEATNYQSALREAKKILEQDSYELDDDGNPTSVARQDVRTIVIFVTDGLATRSLSSRAAGGGNGSFLTERIQDDIIREASKITVDDFYAIGIDMESEEALHYDIAPWMYQQRIYYYINNGSSNNKELVVGAGYFDGSFDQHETGEGFMTAMEMMKEQLYRSVNASTKSIYSATSTEKLKEAFDAIKASTVGEEFLDFTVEDTLSEFVDVRLADGSTDTAAFIEISIEPKTETEIFGTLSRRRKAGLNVAGVMAELGAKPKQVQRAENSNRVEIEFEDTRINETVKIVATYDPVTRSVRMDFPDDYVLSPYYRFRVTIPIEPSEKSYRRYAGNLNIAEEGEEAKTGDAAYTIDYAVYDDSYIPVGDDEVVDLGGESNGRTWTGTHAGEAGFWSNLEEAEKDAQGNYVTTAKVTFKRRLFDKELGTQLIEQEPLYYDRPVVQVQEKTVHIKKVWTDRDGNVEEGNEDLREPVIIDLYEVADDGSLIPVYSDLKDAEGNFKQLYPNGITLDGETDAVETTAWEADFTHLPLFRDTAENDTHKKEIVYAVKERNADTLTYYVLAQDGIKEVQDLRENTQSFEIINERRTALLDVVKDIKGGMGDRDYGFTFRVKFSWANEEGLPIGFEDDEENGLKTFSDAQIVDLLHIYKGKTSDQGEDPVSLRGGALAKEDWEKEGILYKGNGEFEFKLSDDEMVRFDRIPRGVFFEVKELRKDSFEHQFHTSGRIRTNLNDRWESIGKAVHNAATDDYTTREDKNADQTTVTEDLSEIRVRVTNNKDIVRTGLTLQTLPFLLMVLFAIGAVGSFVVITIRRRRLNIED